MLTDELGQLPADPSALLQLWASHGALWQWANYAHGIGRYGASETLWRRQMRAFVARRKAQPGSRGVGFVVAFLIAAAVEATVLCRANGVDVVPSPVERALHPATTAMRELRFLRVANRAALASAPIEDDVALSQALRTELDALDIALENAPAAQSCVWLAGDLLDLGGRIAAGTTTAKVVWRHKSHLLVMVHVYHALRCCGRLCAVGEVDALVRMFRRAVFFRTETLPQRGGFATALALSIGATASSVRRGAPELRHGRILEYTGINPAEWSMLRHVGVFAGAGLDVGAEVDFQATAREEVAVLYRAPTLAGALKLLRVDRAMRLAGVRAPLVLREADEGSTTGSALASAVSCWEQLFPGCGCQPPAPPAAVPLEFSSYTQVAPVEGQKLGTSSYVSTEERLTRAQLTQRYRDGIARAREAR